MVEEGVVVEGEGAVVVKPAVTQFLDCNPPDIWHVVQARRAGKEAWPFRLALWPKSVAAWQYPPKTFNTWNLM